MSDTANSGPLTATLDSTAGGTAAIIETAQEAAEPKKLDLDEASLYSVLVPAGARHELVDTEKYLPAPLRARGTYRPATVEAFIDYAKRHADEEQTTIWVHPTAGKVRAVLDDNAPDGPARREHTAALDLLIAPEWTHWLSKDGRLGSQEEFAEHLEDGIAQIVEPAAADMLEIAQSFHASQSASIRSATRLQSGQVSVVYDEEIKASAGQSGQMEIPTEFELAIPPFVGEEPYAVTARLRYRLNSGQLRIGYRLEQPDAVVRDALSKIAEKLEGEFEHVYMGEPA